MKLSDIRPLTEGAVKDLHQNLLDAIMDEFDLEDTDPMVEKIAAYLLDNADDDEVDSFLYDHFVEGGDMPYGTMKARDGDPANWIADRMEELFKNETRPIWTAQREAKK